MAVEKNMIKGRAQDVTKSCNTAGAHLAKVSLNSTDPVLLVNERYYVGKNVVAIWWTRSLNSCGTPIL